MDRICLIKLNQTKGKKLSLMKSLTDKKNTVQSEEAWHMKIKEHSNYA